MCIYVLSANPMWAILFKASVFCHFNGGINTNFKVLPTIFLFIFNSSSQEFKFIYFNQMNLAQKTTVHNRKTASATISPEIVRLIADINADFTR